MNDKIFRGHLFCGTTIGLTIMSFTKLEPAQVDTIVKIAQGIATIVTAYFAVKNYIYGIREKKARIKQIKDEEASR